MTTAEPTNTGDRPPETPDAATERIKDLERQVADERTLRERAQNNERCFRELAEKIQEVFWMTNPLGDALVYISPAYEHIWGQTCQSLYEDPGRRLAWVHDDDREAVLKAFKRDAANGDYDETFRIDRPDGETRWIRDRAFPVHDDNGDLYRLAGFALDVTDLIASNDRISQLHTRLDASERISVFAALGTGLTHDLGQPLTAARNFIARARMGLAPGPDATRDTLERADQEIARAVATIHHLRDFAREGTPTRRLQPLGPIVDDVHQLLDPALRSAQVRYSGPAPDTLEHIELPIDEVLVQQVLRNLVTNAMDAYAHMNGDAPHAVQVRVNDDEREHVDIEVIDHGCGIGADQALFEPFNTSKAHGTGLGLPVSRRLARSLGGDLLMADRGRAGNSDRPTRFVLRLPRE